MSASDQDPPYKLLSTTLELANVGAGADAKPSWKALAYLNGANAFCQMADSCCIGPAQRHELEKAAEFYVEMALREVRNFHHETHGTPDLGKRIKAG